VVGVDRILLVEVEFEELVVRRAPEVLVSARTRRVSLRSSLCLEE
jgi:hypothetical protein